MKLSLREVSQYLETALDAADAAITGWSIDSRTVQPGDLFFAIKGEKFDGHAFVEAAFEKGAVAAVVDTGAVRPTDTATVSTATASHRVCRRTAVAQQSGAALSRTAPASAAPRLREPGWPR